MSLTKMQKRYIWLAGSYPALVIEQGQGKRTPITPYNVGEEALTIFGYSNPLYFLEGRGLFRRLQSGVGFTLTEEGESAFRKLVLSGDGMDINAGVRHVDLKKSAAPTHAGIGDQGRTGQ